MSSRVALTASATPLPICFAGHLLPQGEKDGSGRSRAARARSRPMARYDFASDNTAPATPEAMQALAAANEGFTSGYGTDQVTAQAADLVRQMLDAGAEVRFVASGTAANAISLAALCRPFEAVVAHEHAHVC